jgi:hypothetical protein
MSLPTLLLLVFGVPPDLPVALLFEGRLAGTLARFVTWEERGLVPVAAASFCESDWTKRHSVIQMVADEALDTRQSLVN